jgi:N-glycosylase/DNA lyase
MKDIYKAYSKKKEVIKKRLNDFSKVKGEDIFYELCFCILTPQSNAKKCDAAIQLLRKENFIKRNFNPVKYLKTNTRFHNNKSRYLMEMKKKYSTIELKRYFLVKNIKGLGLKEASHFLRNIGYRDLAILDRHILKNLYKYSAIKEVPKTLTPKKYFEIEQQFKDFAKKVNIPMDELDLLFWSMETGEVFK